MEGIIYLFIAFPFLVVALILAIIGVSMFVSGLRAKADATVWYGCLLIGGSVACFLIMNALISIPKD